MAKQIVNFKPTGQKTQEGWDKIRPLLDREVFLDLPICVVDWGFEYKEPVLVGQAQNMPLVFEAEEIRLRLQKLETEKQDGMRTFHLAKVNDEIKEVEESKAVWSGLLPEDTKLEELDLGLNGDLIKIVKIEE